MRSTFTLIRVLIVSFISSGELHAQLVSLQMDTAEVKTVMDSIGKQTGMAINYSHELLHDAKKITVHVQNIPLNFVMEHICQGQRFYYNITNTITLIRRKGPEKKRPVMYGYTRNQWNEIVPHVCLTKPGRTYTSNARGFYTMDQIEVGTTLTVTGDSLENTYYVIKYLGLCDIPVIARLKPQETQGYTGYQVLFKKTTSSSSFVTGQDMLQTKTSQSIAERLEGIVPGLLLTNNRIAGINQPRYFLFTGRTTLAANSNPLIIVDNFEFENDLRLINPDDIEDITVLKDASAASIWGRRAANGVIIIRTKSSKNIPRLRVTFNTNVSFGTKPDLFYADQMSSADRVFVDTTLFSAGYFTTIEKSRLRPALSPVIETMYDSLLTPDVKRSRLAAWSMQDNRYDQEKYFYRRSFSQHFSTQIATGSSWYALFLSLGYDKSKPEIQMGREERKTLLLNNRLYLLPGLEVAQLLSFSENTRNNMDGIPEIPVPYGMLTDANGNATSFPYLHRAAYTDTVGGGKLLDWKYAPLTEFRLRNRALTEKDIRFQASVKYNNFGKRLKGLEAVLYVQHQYASKQWKDIHDKKSFFVRDLVNSYSQLTQSGVNRPIPWGDIADLQTNRYNTFNFRFKVSYTKKWQSWGKLEVMAGRDMMKTRGDSSISRIYNYSEKNGSGQNALDYNRNYPQIYFPPAQKKIPYINKEKSEVSYYYSTYLNGTWSYKGKYSLAANGRIDESNLYGSSINRKINPLLSLGLAWLISDERFYPFQNIPFFKLRASYGVSGNPTGNINAIQTISNAGFNANGDPIAFFNNPSLLRLRSDKVRTLNLGFNVRSINEKISVAFDWYQKRAKDLVTWHLVDPTTGNDFLINNNGAMVSRNVDLVVETNNINRLVRWNTLFILSHQSDRIIRTGDTLQQAWAYCESAYFTTVPGKPLYGIFSFPFKGLDTAGNPQGSNGTNYASMLTTSGYDSLMYHGRSTPAVFGSFTNNIYWKQFNLSITLLYKFNYYFRRNSVDYYNIFNGTSKGSADFNMRWQKGKTTNTNVPSMPVTAAPDQNRDLFYKYSDALIERGDHIRLQNINLTCDLGKNTVKKLYLRTASFYVNCSNLGIVWRANKHQIDPDKLTGYPQPRVLTIGFTGTFK